MRSVTFTLRRGLSPEREERVLSEISAREGVVKAARLKPDAKDPTIRLMGFAYLEDSADPEALVTFLSQLPEVESASVPATRGLIR